MDEVVGRFRAHLSAERCGVEDGGALLPVGVARACRATLHVDGVALSVHADRMTVPVGASDPIAALAEKLQFTLGQGPAVDALTDAEVIAASPAVLLARWSQFQQALFEQTPYRAVMTVPLRGPSDAALVLDLYVTDPDAVAAPSLAEVSWVGAEAVRVLSGVLGPVPAGTRPDWFAAPAARARLTVWVAVGQVMTRSALEPDDALELLRAVAFSRATTVDQLAVDIVLGDVDLATFVP